MRRRPAHDLQRERDGRLELEPAVPVEQMAAQEARSERDLGERGIGARPVDRAGPTAIDDPRRESGGDERVDHARANCGDRRRGATLERAQDRVLPRAHRRSIGQARELRLVAEHAVEVQRLGDPAGERDDVGGIAEWAAPHADVQAERPPAHVDVDHDRDPRALVARGCCEHL